MGYPTHLFVEQPNENLICAICFDVYEDCQITNCNHRFCLYCLQLALSTDTSECPICRNKLTLDSFKEDVQMNKVIASLERKSNDYIHIEEQLEIEEFEKPHKKEKQEEKEDGLDPMTRFAMRHLKNQHAKHREPKERKWVKGLILGSKEITLRIISFLNVEDVLVIMLVSKEWNKLANNRYMWKHFYTLQFGKPAFFNSKTDWKQMYYKTAKKYIKNMLKLNKKKMWTLEDFFSLQVDRGSYYIRDSQMLPKDEMTEEMQLFYAQQISAIEYEKQFEQQEKQHIDVILDDEKINYEIEIESEDEQEYNYDTDEGEEENEEEFEYEVGGID